MHAELSDHVSSCFSTTIIFLITSNALKIPESQIRIQYLAQSRTRIGFSTDKTSSDLLHSWFGDFSNSSITLMPFFLDVHTLQVTKSECQSKILISRYTCETNQIWVKKTQQRKPMATISSISGISKAKCSRIDQQSVKHNINCLFKIQKSG